MKFSTVFVSMGSKSCEFVTNITQQSKRLTPLPPKTCFSLLNITPRSVTILDFLLYYRHSCSLQVIYVLFLDFYHLFRKMVGINQSEEIIQPLLQQVSDGREEERRMGDCRGRGRGEGDDEEVERNVGEERSDEWNEGCYLCWWTKCVRE